MEGCFRFPSSRRGNGSTDYSDLHLKEYSNMLLQPSHEQRKLNHQGGIVIYFSLLP
jgi:hypothetical protein